MTRTNVCHAVLGARHIDADRLETHDRAALFSQLFVFLPEKETPSHGAERQVESTYQDVVV